MQAQDIDSHIVNPAFQVKDAEFLNKIYSQVKSLAAMINDKIPDDFNKQECYKSLSLAMYYLSQGLKDRPLSSNTILTK